MFEEDLKHRDWVLYTQEKLFHSIDPYITTEIIDTPNGGKRLIAKNISESTIEKICILTNTDQNNNYLYLEQFYISVYGFSEPLNIPGLNEITSNLYKTADLYSYLNNLKIKKPFCSENIKKNSMNKSITSFSNFVDLYTRLVPCSPFTLNKIKLFTIVLNPDAV